MGIGSVPHVFIAVSMFGVWLGGQMGAFKFVGLLCRVRSSRSEL
jgi:hypothetical protein